MPTDPAKLHVCKVRIGGSLHPCVKARRALEEAGYDVEVSAYGWGRPGGIGTAGKRPEIEALSGQEKLPVLEFANGEAIAGSGDIVAWAEANPKT